MKEKMNKNHKWVFFGTPDIAVSFLDTLAEQDYYPDMIVTRPDAAAGRKMQLQASPVKKWAQQHAIEVFECDDFSDREKIQSLLSGYDYFFVFAFGVILPEWLINLPAGKTLNLHPSLLPHLRGPSPVQTAILQDKKHTGLTIIQIDHKMDHGAIVAQEIVTINEWKKYSVHEHQFARRGSLMLLEIIDSYLDGTLLLQDQNHDAATYCGFYNKSDMEIRSDMSEREKYLRYCAFSKPFMFDVSGKRYIVTDARYTDDKFEIIKVIPEGKKEILFSEIDFKIKL
tara:strand:- start:114 stop:965 length:852 start_codon:yes stop_codon:yes gene_type:complete